MAWSVKLTRTGEADINGTSVIRVDENEITCDFDLSGAAPGFWDVIVTNDEGRTDTLIGGFEVELPVAPTVSAITPSSGYMGSSVAITNLAGTNFAAGCTVEFRKLGETTIHATGVIVESSTKITCTVNLAGVVGDWDVVVVDAYLQEDILVAGFEILTVPDPTILAVNPSSGGVNKLVTISGVNFGVSQEQSKVFFSNAVGLFEAEISSWGSAEIICYSPEIPILGDWDIVVRIVSNE